MFATDSLAAESQSIRQGRPWDGNAVFLIHTAELNQLHVTQTHVERLEMKLDTVDEC